MIPILLLFGGALFCAGGSVVRAQEDAAATRLRERLGPGSDVSVKVTLAGFESLTGNLRRVKILVKNGDLMRLALTAEPSRPGSASIRFLEAELHDSTYRGESITSAKLQLRDVRYDASQFRKDHSLHVATAGPGTLSVELPVESLESTLEKRVPGSKFSIATMSEDRLRIRATVPLLGRPTSLNIVGKPVRLDGTSLGVRASEIEVNGKVLKSDQFAPYEAAMRMDFAKWQLPGLVFTLGEVAVSRIGIKVAGTVSLSTTGSAP